MGLKQKPWEKPQVEKTKEEIKQDGGVYVRDFFLFRESSGVSELNLEVDIFDRYIRCQHLLAFADIGCQQTFQPTQHSFKHLSQCIYDSFQPLTLNQKLFS